MPKKTATICGAVNAAILEKVDRLFRNDDAGVWTELLQNARRAGASRVDIAIEEPTPGRNQCLVTVHDNGKGIDDFQALLTLGSSRWDGETQFKEDPAGMGFFSLCRSEVDVHSGKRSVTISPDVFLGKRRAQVRRTRAHVLGTRICFTRDSNKAALTAALERVTEFCPVEVRLDGRALERHDFLEGSLYRETIDGIEVGFATQFSWNWGCHNDGNWNFYGARIHQPFAAITGLLDSQDQEPRTIYARFNVLEAARVRLQLPDRRAIIQDASFHAFQRKARAAAYRFFQTQARHALPFQNWKEAKELGVTLPEAAVLLKTWHAEPMDDGVDPLFGRPTTEVPTDLSQAILVDRWLSHGHTLEGALHSGAELSGVLYCENPEYAGYPWYNQLPRIVKADVFIDGLYSDDWEFRADQRPKTIKVQLEVAEGNEERRIVLPAKVHAVSDECGWLEFVAVRNSPWDNDELSGPFSIHDFLIAATFSASDDYGECDSWNTQMGYYSDQVERVLNKYFRGAKATLLALLRTAINSDAKQLATELGLHQIRFTRQPSSEDQAPSWNIELA